VRVVSDKEKSQTSVPVTQYDVVVVGAGPYGLSTAAHLIGRGLHVAVFGKVLKLWREHMPPRMFLRSHWWATNLSDPDKKFGFERFFREVKQYKKCYPLPIEAFIDYGLWFQKHAVPNVDETYVATIERSGEQFLLTLEDGRKVQSRAVVMAIGLNYYANVPEEYSHMPRELVSHSFDHASFNHFAGKQVVVVGGGQSAVEYTALLHEINACVHLITRRAIYWLETDEDDERSFFERVLAPNAGIAPGWINWMLEFLPYLFYHLPQNRKDRFIRNRYVAAASDWLRDRVIGKAVLHENQKIEAVRVVGNSVEVVLGNGEKLKADHVMLATGYKVDINRLPMLHPSLLAQIKTDMDIPILNAWFESSVPGLYFIGLTSLRSYGPLYRFVLGCKATAPRVAVSVAKRVARTK
jgi:thioredoxin reductase